MLDLLQLKVPKLFAVEEGGKEDEEVCLQFSAFLRNYISRNALKLTILGQIRNILVSDRGEGRSGVGTVGKRVGKCRSVVHSS